ncbi:MAG: SDR family oxidoreductase [Fimbriimonadaceae bacterium]|nr:SDR family oxidoreductase [Alphaproteobacteria bacterium]
MTDMPRAVVITGAAGDLGRALCDSFLADDLIVYAADRVEVPSRPGLEAVTLDVTDRSRVTALAERVGREVRMEAWINGAGTFLACPVLEAGTEDWQRIIAVNLTGTFYGCAAALPVLAAGGGGRIVNIGSISGQVGGIGAHPAYGASKAGVHALTKTYALEGARFGVLCNAVAPGLLAGGMAREFSDAQQEKLARATPMRRLGTMAEITRVVRFLADPANTYMTGAVVPVNGGAFMP